MTPAPSPAPRARSRALPALAAALLGAAWCVWLSGLQTLDPRNTDWTLQADWAMAQLVQSFFRDEPWRLPLGDTPRYLHPVGALLSSADGIPWLGLLVRPFAALLPRDFQVLGAWFVLCFALQGALGALLTARLSASRVDQLLGGLLFALTPFLYFRSGHLALCAQWLLVGMLWLALGRPDARAARRRRLLALLFVVLAAGVHPYLCAMVLALAAALLLQLRAPGAPRWHEPGWLGAYVLAALGVVALLGYARVGGSASGFEYYSANLLTFVNPGNLSRFLPALTVGPDQYEGYGYLGAGVLALGAGGLAYALGPGRRTLPWRAVAPLVAVCLLMGVFALSHQVRLGEWRVLSYARLYRATLEPVGAVFRVPGRFVWPLGYLCVAGALALLFRALRHRPRVATALLGGAVLLQAVELPPAPSGTPFAPQPVLALDSALWARAAGDYAHLVLYPPLLHDGAGNTCGQETFGSEAVAVLGREAHRQRLTVNSGYVARIDPARMQTYCAQLEAQLARGELEPRSVYVVHEAAAPAFLARTRGRAQCGRLDGLHVCVAAHAAPGFRALLAERSDG